MSALTVGAVAETAPGERRVALSPDGAARLQTAGQQVIVEAGAGAAAWFPDTDYADAGARLVTRRELYAQADIVVCIHPPAEADVSQLRPGQVLIGLLAPLIDPHLARSLADAKVTAISLDGLPRTLSAAQSMGSVRRPTSPATKPPCSRPTPTAAGLIPDWLGFSTSSTLRPEVPTTSSCHGRKRLPCGTCGWTRLSFCSVPS